MELEVEIRKFLWNNSYKKCPREMWKKTSKNHNGVVISPTLWSIKIFILHRILQDRSVHIVKMEGNKIIIWIFALSIFVSNGSKSQLSLPHSPIFPHSVLVTARMSCCSRSQSLQERSETVLISQVVYHITSSQLWQNAQTITEL